MFLAKYNIPVLDHELYSRDLAPIRFLSVPQGQMCIKRNKISEQEAVKKKKKTGHVTKEVTGEDFE